MSDFPSPRWRHRSRLLLLLLAALPLAACGSEATLHDGDIIFHTSRSAQSAAIQRATHSRYSHMGLVLHKDGKPYVFEAVSTVRFTPLAQWIARGEGGRYVVKRWRDAPQRLDKDGAARLRREAVALAGKPYDLAFAWSDARIYCSELVWKAYQRAFGVRLGETQRLRDFDLTDKAVQAKMKERYGKQIPLDEIVISPAAMFDSDLLQTVVHK